MIPAPKKASLHRIAGWAATSLIPAYYKYDEQAEKLVNFLKHGPDGNGVLNIDIFALERENAPADKAPGRAARPHRILCRSRRNSHRQRSGAEQGHRPLARPRAARFLRVVDQLHREGCGGQGTYRERIHQARRRTRPIGALVHQSPRQHQGRTERHSPDLAQPRAGLQQHASSPAARKWLATVSACPRATRASSP